MRKLGKNLVIALILLNMACHPALAQETLCNAKDRDCVLGLLDHAAGQIDTPAWRDQTYRELAKTYAFEGQLDPALAQIDKIESPDTKAMTIRGIGMAMAAKHLDQSELDAVFLKLRAEADKITHPPSFAIALTYIAMSQAYAGDNDGAWHTASEMDNDALRHKAYGETAEIQAEKGDYGSAMKSISFIESEAYKNKSYSIVSQILAENRHYDEALKAAMFITNPYKKAAALQFLLDQQKPRESEHE